MTSPDQTPAAPSAGAAGGRRWGDLVPRVLSGLVLVAVALGTAIRGGHVFALFWLTASVAVLWEWERLVGRGRAGLPFVAGGAALAIAVGCAAAGLPGPAVLAVLAGMAAALGLGTGPGRPMAAAGVAYAGALGIAVVLLRNSVPGLVALFWTFAVVWGTDVMAYFAGRLIGGPKLWPRLSPSKTWSGFLVGITAGALAGLAVSPADGSRGAVFALGLAVAAASQGGDLFESRLKRWYGVKDSSRLIPGHGGVMDRLDGFVAAVVLALAVGGARAGLDAAGLGLFYWS